MKRFWGLAILCVLLTGFARAEGTPIPAYTSKTKATVGYFGTVCGLCLFYDDAQPEAAQRFESVWEEIKTMLETVENAVSVSVPSSDIARFNALGYGASIEVSAMTADMVRQAKRMYEETNGYYDPTVYPLVDLWGFSPRFTYRDEVCYAYDRARVNGVLPPPDRRYIEAFLPLVGMDGVALEGDEAGGYRLCKRTPPVTVDGVVYQAQLDLGGMAKGYVVDKVMARLWELGYEYGYFSLGGSSIGLMKTASLSAREADDPRFELAIRRPRETGATGSAYATVRVENQSLSSSGDYDHHYLADGEICCHLINPFTGYPVNLPSDGVQRGICTVTLLSGSAMEDDALTTALCLMGPEQAVRFYNERLRQRDVVMVFYRADRQTYEVVTNLREDGLRILDGAYRLASETDEEGRIAYVGELLGNGGAALPGGALPLFLLKENPLK